MRAPPCPRVEDETDDLDIRQATPGYARPRDLGTLLISCQQDGQPGSVVRFRIEGLPSSPRMTMPSIWLRCQRRRSASEYGGLWQSSVPTLGTLVCGGSSFRNMRDPFCSLQLCSVQRLLATDAGNRGTTGDPVALVRVLPTLVPIVLFSACYDRRRLVVRALARRVRLLLHLIPPCSYFSVMAAASADALASISLRPVAFSDVPASSRCSRLSLALRACTVLDPAFDEAALSFTEQLP